MNLKDLTKEELQEIPMVEIAFEIMTSEGKPMNYYDLFEKVAEIKGFSEEEKEERLIKLYTDINIDGRFYSIGDNQWGLKKWYPVDQTEEEITTSIRKKKRLKDADHEDDLDLEYDEFDEEEYDDLDEDFEEIDEDEDLDDIIEDDDELAFDDKDELDDLDDDLLDDADFPDDEQID